MSHEPGADEREIHDRLVGLIDGPPAVPPKPTSRPRDWLDDILDTRPAPKPAAEEAPKPKPATKPGPKPDPPVAPTVEKTDPKSAPDKKKPQAKTRKRRRRKRKRPGPDTPRSAFDTRPPSPRQSLLDAWDAIPYRLKWLAYHAAAAYLGWSIGLVDWATYVTRWIADGRLANPQAIFWYLAGAATLLLHHATRRRWWPVAWLAAVPATSTVVGVLIYGTPHP